MQMKRAKSLELLRRHKRRLYPDFSYRECYASAPSRIPIRRIGRFAGKSWNLSVHEAGVLKVGIIGLGVGEAHIPGYAKHPDCMLSALCDRDSEKTERGCGAPSRNASV